MFWQELKRRKVFRVIAMYAATAFIILEAADIILPRLGLPDWTVTILIIIVMIGFPVTAVVSWIYDITPEGILKTKKADTEKENNQVVRKSRSFINANNVIIAILFAVVCILLYPKIFKRTIIEDMDMPSKQTNNLIAVLPFTNSKPDPDTDYLGFAMADQIIGELLYKNNITVRSSGSIRKYVQRVIDPLAIGDSLHVDYVLIGNYLKEGNMVRLNIELLEVGSNEMIWREPIEVDFKSTFELQDMVALKVVEGLNIQFTPGEAETLGTDIPGHPLAYEYYLRSISYPTTLEGDRLAIEMLKKSIELDSTYAPAYAQLGDRLHRQAHFELGGTEALKAAENSYLKALSLKEDDIFALTNLAKIYTETSRKEKAVELVRQVLEINPSNAEAHFSLGYIYRYAGMNDEAVQQMEQAMAIDPQNPGFRSIAVTYQLAGEYEKSLESARLFKPSEFILAEQGAALYRMGNMTEAVYYFNRSLAMNPDGLLALWVTGLKAVIEGNIEQGLEATRQIEMANLADGEVWYHCAGNYGLLGDRKGCIRALGRAVEEGFFNYPTMLSDSYLDLVREDKEFLKILQKAREKHLAFKSKYF